MANVLALLELRQGAVLPVSLEALGQGRRVASTLGATLYALVPLPEAPAYGEDDLIAVCARCGADKVVLLTDEGLRSGAEMRHGTHGRAIATACEQFPPAVVVMGATFGARDVAPRLAAHLGAAYLPEGWLEIERDRLLLCDRDGRALLQEEDERLEFPVVVTVPAGRYAAARGDEEAEMLIVAAPARPADFVEVAEQEPAA